MVSPNQHRIGATPTPMIVHRLRSGTTSGWRESLRKCWSTRCPNRFEHTPKTPNRLHPKNWLCLVPPVEWFCMFRGHFFSIVRMCDVWMDGRMGGWGSGSHAKEPSQIYLKLPQSSKRLSPLHPEFWQQQSATYKYRNNNPPLRSLTPRNGKPTPSRDIDRRLKKENHFHPNLRQGQNRSSGNKNHGVYIYIYIYI